MPKFYRPYVSKHGGIVLRSPFHKKQSKIRRERIEEQLKKFYSDLSASSELKATKKSKHSFGETDTKPDKRKNKRRKQDNHKNLVTKETNGRIKGPKGKKLKQDLTEKRKGYDKKLMKKYLSNDDDDDDMQSDDSLSGDDQDFGGGRTDDLPIANDLDDPTKPKKKVEKVENKRVTNPSTIINFAQSLHERMKDRLDSSRFRHINEQLYTHTSQEASEGFQNNPSAFEIYHTGYQKQLEKWPIKPVDIMIKLCNRRPTNWVIADMGCGDAKLADSVKQKVHSFDLVSTKKGVINCDIAKVPLKDKSVNMVIYCLSLMGTNIDDFLLEANRILVVGGLLKIAEVESRFRSIYSFVKGMEQFGFSLQKKDTDYKMFILFHFVKTGPPAERKKRSPIRLMPCLYKKR